MEHVQWCHRLC